VSALIVDPKDEDRERGYPQPSGPAGLWKISRD
jgi:hypothetical protein